MLDTYGEQASVGKMIGGDIQQNKKTILYLKALEHLGELESDFLSLYESDLDIKEKLPKVIAMMDSCHTKEKITLMKEDYLAKALAALNKVNAPFAEGKKALQDLAIYIIERSK